LEHNEHRTNNPGVSPKASLGQVRRLLSLKEAAILLGVSTASVRRLIWAGRLSAVRLNRHIRLDVRDLERLIEQAKERPG
jgi:excisionase family DNA binding protein